MSDSPTPDLSSVLQSALGALGYQTFRPGQEDAIRTLLEERRLLLVAPTGGGKSLIYQLPALVLRGTVLVISPLVSLMHDQVAALSERGVSATYLAATLDAEEQRRRLRGLGEGAYSLVYVAPERLAFPGFRARLANIRVPLVAIDEAHCISEWGHDFRPDYLQIGELLQTMAPAHVLACTATATPVVRDEILARLGLPAETTQMVRGFARPNLALDVLEIAKAKHAEQHLDAAIAGALGGPGAHRGTAIVYAPTRRRTSEEAQRLAARGWRAAAYHAGLDGRAREGVQSAFIAGDLEVVVATNAFGMGIDRSDVRLVVHLAPPGSIEAYYQEVGRAGRDGEPARAVLFSSSRDLPLRRRLLESGGDGPDPPPAVVEHKWNLFLELMRWCEGGTCRHDAILRYFGDEAETLDGCGRCDVCRALSHGRDDASPEEVDLVVRKALSGVARVHGRFGLGAAVALLAGVEDPRLARSGLDQVKTFGVLSDRSPAWLTRMLRRCATAGWVDFQGGDRARVVVLTPEGRAVMKGERPGRIVLPGEATEVTVPRRESKAKPEAEAMAQDEEALAVFEALRRHRMERAKAEGVPPYVVASDRTLRDIAMLRPRSLDELAVAHGIGPTKLERYGEGLLDTVRRARA